MDYKIAPSILACDFGKIQEEIKMVNESQADWLHIDVMDGVFVPNISFGQPLVKKMSSLCTKICDVHLMITKPERYIQEFRDAGADYITVHAEATDHLHRVIQQIKDSGAKAGVALNPHTPLSVLEHVLEDLDLVCLMSVNPGFGGQKFIYQTLRKIELLRAQLIEINSECLIEVDGGVGLQNMEKIIQAGANVLVAGSSVFKSEDPPSTIERMKNYFSNN